MSQPLVPALNAHWLIDPTVVESAQLFPSTPILQREYLPLPPEVGHSWFDRMPLAAGVTVIHAVAHFQPEASGTLIALGEFEMNFPEPIFSAQVMQIGTTCHREHYPAVELIYKPGHDFFRHADRFHTTPLLDASSDSDMTSLLVTETAMNELLGKDMAQLLIARLGIETMPAAKVLPMPAHVSAPLRACMSASLQGPLQKLFTQSKVLEYLCTLANHVITDSPPLPPLSRKNERIRALHDQLIRLEGKLPALEVLSEQFGMSARHLNEEFSRTYGQPIYAFISDRRLNDAHVAICNSDVPLKTLAARLGYSHVNHFNSAFKKKFGVAPGSLRKKAL